MHIRDYLATLDFVNEVRAGLGLPSLDYLPAGTPASTTDCVIARALPGAVVRRAVVFDNITVELPRPAKRFISKFDFGWQSDAALLVKGGTEDDKGCLVSA